MRFHRRLLATVVDAALGFLLGLALASTPLGYYFSARAVVLLRIGESGTWFQGPVAMVIGMFGELVFLLPFVLALALLPEAIGGRGLGKRVCALRIVGAPGALAKRYLVKTSPLWLSVWALVSGAWLFEQIAIAAALGLVLGWLVPSLAGASSLHDRAAGTLLRGVEIR